MQRRYTMLFAALVFSISMLPGQVAKIVQPQKHLKAPYLKMAVLPQENVPLADNPTPMAPKQATARNPEEVIGTTVWDAQSYGSMPSRIFANPDGSPAATWLFSDNTTGNPDRGTAYSTRKAGVWSSATARIETVRTGFPASTILGDGTTVVIAHNTAVGHPYKIHVATKAPGEDTWSETDMPTATGNIGLLWPRIAVGGADGKTIHIIAITTPVGNGGALYEGVDAQILYARSTDGGATWDKIWEVVPGLDKNKYARNGADAYTIDAYLDAVAIASFPDWNDIAIFKSMDNGNNWETITAYNYPDAVENYAALAGDSYTLDDIGGIDPEAPDSLAVFTSDGFGGLILDKGFQAHLWFGRSYLVDNDSAAGSFYYPTMNGLCYWNESKGVDNIEVITGALDYNGDTLLNIDGGNAAIGPYYNSLSSFVSPGIDDDGTLYIAYAAVHELYRSDWGAEKDQYYRHIYMMKSADGGANWGDPLEITADPYADTTLLPYTEAVWPAIPRNIGEKVWLIYQNDNIPGCNIWGTNHVAGPAQIPFVEIDKAAIPAAIVSGTGEAPGDLDFQISPNPVSEIATITANWSGEGKAAVEVFDLFGRRAMRLQLAGSGQQTLTFPVQNLAPGAYVIRLSEGGRTGAQKFLKL